MCLNVQVGELRIRFTSVEVIGDIGKNSFSRGMSGKPDWREDKRKQKEEFEVVNIINLGGSYIIVGSRTKELYLEREMGPRENLRWEKSQHSFMVIGMFWQRGKIERVSFWGMLLSEMAWDLAKALPQEVYSQFIYGPEREGREETDACRSDRCLW